MSAAVAEAHEEETHGLGHATNTGISNEKLAMWTFLGSECLLFGALLSTYFLYRGRSTAGPTPDDVYDIPFTSVSSFVLLMSSLTMVLAVSAIQRGDHKRLRIYLLATAVLGATFIAGQVYEFTSFIREGLTLRSNVFGSSFFVLTGFHGVHVTLGIVMLLSLWSLSMKGRIPTERAEVVEIAGLYWHFVDIVWVVLFTVVYLVPSPAKGFVAVSGPAAPSKGKAVEQERAHEPHGPTDRQYVAVFLILAVVTGIEVGLYYVNIGAANNPALLLLAAIKFVIVGGYFMHLKFDNPLLRRLFVTGLVLALFCYFLVFFMFRIF